MDVTMYPYRVKVDNILHEWGGYCTLICGMTPQEQADFTYAMRDDLPSTHRDLVMFTSDFVTHERMVRDMTAVAPVRFPGDHILYEEPPG